MATRQQMLVAHTVTDVLLRISSSTTSDLGACGLEFTIDCAQWVPGCLDHFEEFEENFPIDSINPIDSSIDSCILLNSLICCVFSKLYSIFSFARPVHLTIVPLLNFNSNTHSSSTSAKLYRARNLLSLFSYSHHSSLT